MVHWTYTKKHAASSNYMDWIRWINEYWKAQVRSVNVSIMKSAVNFSERCRKCVTGHLGQVELNHLVIFQKSSLQTPHKKTRFSKHLLCVNSLTFLENNTELIISVKIRPQDLILDCLKWQMNMVKIFTYIINWHCGLSTPKISQKSNYKFAYLCLPFVPFVTVFDKVFFLFYNFLLFCDVL